MAQLLLLDREVIEWNPTCHWVEYRTIGHYGTLMSGNLVENYTCALGHPNIDTLY